MEVKLAGFLRSGKDCERKPTSVQGVELAEYKKLLGDERLASLLNTVDRLSPKPLKKEEPGTRDN